MSQVTIKRKAFLEEIIERLDLPESVEDKVRNRYYSLGKWFNREKSSLKDVTIFVQGSFGQGTTIKPLSEDSDYDLDMSCKVNILDFKSKYTQRELMQMVKYELELYRKNVGIETEIEEKRRCLRLYYKDEVSFHLDFVPSIPLKEEKSNDYQDTLLKFYEKDENLALELVKYAVNIPDKESDNYNYIDDKWHISNQQGYLLWFQSKMLLNEQREFKSSTEPIPKYSEKTVLQRCIQLLKRHRDTMFSDKKMNDCKPISIIISTLAARAYSGEQNIEEAIINILHKMPNYINNFLPRIPNPVKPEEDFTDRWDTLEGKELNLEGNFRNWLLQAKLDFNKLLTTKSYETANIILKHNFSIEMDKAQLTKKFNFDSDKKNVVNSLPKDPPKLWGDKYRY